jgi:hypothetical protein
MSTIEELRRDCAYCRQPITLKWKNGPMPSEGVCLGRRRRNRIFQGPWWNSCGRVVNI